jgi:hypothetical protein
MENSVRNTRVMTHHSTLAVFASLFFVLGAPLSPALAGGNISLPSSHEIAATAPAVSAQAGRGVVARWDSNPWVPVAAILLTVAVAPFIRRHLAR